MTSSYYRGAQGAILVYDISSRKTFDELIKWFQELETYTGDNVAKMVVGNKVDKVGAAGWTAQCLNALSSGILKRSFNRRRQGFCRSHGESFCR